MNTPKVHTPVVSEHSKRKATLCQFELQKKKYPVLTVQSRLPNSEYLLKLHDAAREVDVIAVVLYKSFDYYRYRLNVSLEQGIGMVICMQHDCVLPVYCLELDTAMFYDIAVEPDCCRPVGVRKKRNAVEVQVFVSSLLCSKSVAMKELYSFPPRTKQRYLALRDTYLKKRVGRPWAS